MREQLFGELFSSGAIILGAVVWGAVIRGTIFQGAIIRWAVFLGGGCPRALPGPAVAWGLSTSRGMKLLARAVDNPPQGILGRGDLRSGVRVGHLEKVYVLISFKFLAM